MTTTSKIAKKQPKSDQKMTKQHIKQPKSDRHFENNQTFAHNDQEMTEENDQNTTQK